MIRAVIKAVLEKRYMPYLVRTLNIDHSITLHNP